MTHEIFESVNSKKSKQALLEQNRLLREKLAEIEAESRYRREREQALSRSIEIGYWEWDEVNNRPAYLSEQFAAILGFPQDELYEIYQSEEDLFPFIHPDDLEYYKKHELMHAREKNVRGQD